MPKKITKKAARKELTGINLRALKKRLALIELNIRLLFDMIDETRKMIRRKK